MKAYFISEKCSTRLSIRACDAETMRENIEILSPFTGKLIKVDALGFFIHRFGFHSLGARFKL